MDQSEDTGVKLTGFLVINEEKYVDKEYGTITIQGIKPNGEADEEKTFKLRNNSFIIIKSRIASYRVQTKSQKVFLGIMKIGGPKMA